MQNMLAGGKQPFSSHKGCYLILIINHLGKFEKYKISSHSVAEDVTDVTCHFNYWSTNNTYIKWEPR